MFLEENSRVRVEDLIRGVIVQSGNDAAIVIAEGLAGTESAFIREMQAKAREIGLTKSTFRNATGWPDPGHRMTVRDLAVLAVRTIRDFPQYYSYYSERRFKYNGISQPNRNPLLRRKLGADGLKTGHTEEAGFGLTGSVERDGRRLILVLNGLNSSRARAHEAERLIEWAYREFDNFTLFGENETVLDAEVWLGASATVPLVPKEPLVVTLSHLAREDMKVSVVYQGPIPAPIQAGQQVGKVVVEARDEPPIERFLYAGSDVAQLGFFGRITAAFGYLLWGSLQEAASVATGVVGG